MLYLVHRVAISIKLRPVKLEQAVSESLPHKGLYTELLGVQLTCLDPVPASIRARNAQEINITVNFDCVRKFRSGTGYTYGAG